MKLLQNIKLQLPGNKEKILSADYWKTFINANQRMLQPLLFIGGFTYDSLTMVRVDNVLDNIIFALYLLIITAIVYFQLRLHNKLPIPKLIEAYTDYLPLLIQFLFGALMSGYLIYYFQSAADAKAFLFVLALAFLMVGNEFLEKRYNRLVVIMPLTFFAMFSFLLFFIPTVSKHLGASSFWMALIITYLLIVFLWLAGHGYFKKEDYPSALQHPFYAAMGMIAALLILLYYSNTIPPVPLSLKTIGIYKSVEKTDSDYILKYTPNPWYCGWRNYNNKMYYREGEQIACFASVFAPGGLKEKIIHNWQIYSPEQQSWLDVDRIEFQMTGGRDAGYRGYTMKTKIRPGDWRVRILNDEEKLIAKVNFTVLAVDSLFRDIKKIKY